jgi:small neutral amino acid transporter SnatA (MarC family)
MLFALAALLYTTHAVASPIAFPVHNAPISLRPLHLRDASEPTKSTINTWKNVIIITVVVIFCCGFIVVFVCLARR